MWDDHGPSHPGAQQFSPMALKIVDSFAGGKYLVFGNHKPAKLPFNKVRGETVTLSGMFFDPKP